MRVGVVVPTIRGRERSLERTLAAYRETLAAVDVELVLRIARNFRFWPSACNAATPLLLEAGCDVVHYGADDLVPLEGWLEPCLPLLEAGELPAPRVWDFQAPPPPRPDGAPSQALDGASGQLCRFTRVPILTAAMARRVGPWPEIAYYADCWLSDRARLLGWSTRVCAGYDFVHFWHPHGRLEQDGELGEAASAVWQMLSGRSPSELAVAAELDALRR